MDVKARDLEPEIETLLEALLNSPRQKTEDLLQLKRATDRWVIASLIATTCINQCQIEFIWRWSARSERGYQRDFRKRRRHGLHVFNKRPS